MRKKPYFVRPDNKGFTLIEILVAMAVLAILTIPLLSYFSDASKLNALSSKRHKANLTAQAVMEDFKNKKIDVISEEYQNLSGGSGQYTDETYTTKLTPATPFAFTQNAPDAPYYFQLSNYNLNGVNYDVRIKVQEGAYRVPKVTASGGTIYFNTFRDFDISDVEGNKNAVIVEGVNDSKGAASSLFNRYLEKGGTNTSLLSYIESRLKRVIKLSVNTVTGGSINVRCSFEYSCEETGIPELSGEKKTINRFEKNYADLGSLECIYLFYRPLYDSIRHEEIKVDSNLSPMGDFSRVFDFYIIGKNAESHDTYKLYDTSSPEQLLYDGTNPPGNGNTTLKNNVTVVGSTEVRPVGNTYRSAEATYYNRQTAYQQRLFEIEVAVYTAGHAGESDNLIFTLNSAEDD